MATKPASKKEEPKKKAVNAQETTRVQLEKIVETTAGAIQSGQMEMAYAVESISREYQIDPPSTQQKIEDVIARLKAEAEASGARQAADEAAEVARVAANKALAAAAAAEGKVVINSPRAFKIRLDNQKEVFIQKGAQSVPKDIAEHWYCKANGVTVLA
jgi:hypothetical protein